MRGLVVWLGCGLLVVVSICYGFSGFGFSVVVGSVGGQFSLEVVMGTNLWWFRCGGGGFVVICLGFVASGGGF